MKICSVCNKENNNVDGNFCVFCGGKLVKKRKEKENKKIINTNISNEEQKINNRNLKIIVIVLIILLAGVTGLAIYLKINDNTQELKNKISNLEKQNSTLKKEKNELNSEKSSLLQKNLDYSSKIDFFDEYVVFVIDGYGRYYYTYDQMEQVTQGKPVTFWAYNIEQAIDLGYRAWE